MKWIGLCENHGIIGKSMETIENHWKSLEFNENHWNVLESFKLMGNHWNRWEMLKLLENAFTGLRRETVCRKKWEIPDSIRRKCSRGKTVCRKKWEILDVIRRKCFSQTVPSTYYELSRGNCICVGNFMYRPEASWELVCNYKSTRFV